MMSIYCYYILKINTFIVVVSDWKAGCGGRSACVRQRAASPRPHTHSRQCKERGSSDTDRTLLFSFASCTYYFSRCIQQGALLREPELFSGVFLDKPFIDVADRREATLVGLETQEWGSVEECAIYNPLELALKLDSSKAAKGKDKSAKD